MKALDTENTLCTVPTKTLKLLGDFWVLKIIEALSKQELRYCGIQRAVGNINPVTLSKKLTILEKASLISRTEEEKTHVTYSLTQKGRLTFPIIKAIRQFAEKTS